MLEAKNISFAYLKSKKILDDISLSFGENEVVGIIGPSGCGKSTFAKIISGYLQPSQGEVLFENKPLQKSGYCPVQLIYQHPEHAVNPKWKMQRVLTEAWAVDDETMEAFGIRKEWLNRWPSELSGGELQRFCIARAMGERTKFLIADEMTTMLDAITQAYIWDIVIKQVRKRNIGMIVVTHNHALADRLCDRILNFEDVLKLEK